MPYTPILATLGYIFSPDRSQVLLVHRTARPQDAHYGKYNGLGGKLRSDEDVVSGLCREVYEEAGIACEELELAGTISWPGFGKGGEDWFGFIFRVLRFRGEPKQRNAEGTLEWVAVEKVPELPLWEGDRYFLPMALTPGAPPFHGVMPYRDGRPLSWHYCQAKSDARILFAAQQ